MFMFLGYREEGDITTPFDMRVRNELDRFSLWLRKLSWMYLQSPKKVHILINRWTIFCKKHHDFIREEGTDLPEVRTVAMGTITLVNLEN